MRRVRSAAIPNHEEQTHPPASSFSPSVEFLNQAEALIPAEIRMISGCEDQQTSADVPNVLSTVHQLPNPAGRSGGACTSALLGVLYEHQQQQQQASNNRTEELSFQQVLLRLRESLRQNGFEQIPQLSSSRPLDCKETPFHIVNPNSHGGGTKRALLVGINYKGQDGELKGCHNDIQNIKKYIKEIHGFAEDNIMVLTDDENDDARNLYEPTKEKIIFALRALVANSVAGDTVFFHYSGHGGLLEPIGNPYKIQHKTIQYDETIIPIDYKVHGQIRDFSLYNDFVRPMNAGVFVTCIMDCCHSGSVLDLPYKFLPTDTGSSGSGIPPTIQMYEDVDGMSNLVFLFTLAGGILQNLNDAGLFDPIKNHLDNILEGSLSDYHNLGFLGNDWTTLIQDERAQETMNHFIDFFKPNDEDTTTNNHRIGTLVSQVATAILDHGGGGGGNSSLPDYGAILKNDNTANNGRDLDTITTTATTNENHTSDDDDDNNNIDNTNNTTSLLCCLCQMISKLIIEFLKDEDDHDRKNDMDSHDDEDAPYESSSSRRHKNDDEYTRLLRTYIHGNSNDYDNDNNNNNNNDNEDEAYYHYYKQNGNEEDDGNDDDEGNDDEEYY